VANRAVLLTCLGEPRAGVNATTPGIPAEPNDDTFHTLGALHGPLPREIPAQPATTAVQVDLATLRSVISRLRSGVAPGPSGLT
jgi:hypothetical protein